jgi:diguanylate cyclase (GGDEF)-like protein
VRRSLDLHAAASDDGSSRLSDLMSPADLAQFTELALETLEESNTWTGELTIKVTPDVAVPMWSVGVIRRGTDGEIEWAGMMARNISRLKEAESELRRLAEHDDLTGLPNRKALLEVVGEAVETLDEGPSVALVFCDLDGFKAINDVHGHAVGDQALSVLGRRLSGAVRSGDVAARVGGDEFVVLCRDADDEEAVAALAERIIATLAAPVSVAGFEVQVGSSLGIARAAVGTTDLDADRLLSAADTAMYRAKAMGGNRFRIVAME